MSIVRFTFCLALLLCSLTVRGVGKQSADLWVLKPVSLPEVPRTATDSANPIDAFVAAELNAKGLKPVGQADRLTLLRRVHLDLTGITPTRAEQDAFLHDEAADSYDK